MIASTRSWTSRSRIESAGLWATLLLPLAVTLVAWRYTVNVGFFDDWEWTPIILSAKHGELLWGAMWALHNNHRIFFPDLIALVLARFGSWSLPRETMFSVAVAALTQLTWLGVIRRLVPARRQVAAFILVSLLVFSLAQAENWIWGFQIAWFIANLAIAITAYALTFRGDWRWTLVACVAALVAAHSVGYGPNVLFAGLVCAIAARRRSTTEIVVWSALTVVVFAWYVHDFSRGPALPPTMSAGDRIAQSLYYVFAYLGAPIARSLGLVASAIAGFIALAAYAFAVASWLRGRMQQADADVPSTVALALAVVPILTAVQVAYARLWQGLPNALSSHFVTSSELLWIALALVYAAPRAWITPLRNLAWVAYSVALVAFVDAQFGGYRDIQDRAMDIFAAAQALPQYQTATQDQIRALWPAEVFVHSLDEAHEGPFARAATP